MVERVKATFPIAYGLEVPRDAEKVGAYWEERRKIIHATNFIIDTDKKVTQACFATGPIGRIVAEDALQSIQGAKRRTAQGSSPGSIHAARKTHDRVLIKG